ncbi:unnamed protein product [Cuscuta campestris]|uniref:Retrovirus-related Pol polyprotein from transposon TNT 1-94-like beta-barrel domain-containing protein n=1 Tax=Cuscuta campestris TaxID=132261 RepID=A0A484LJD1_9ASTE|nr:unnamed protein product [Cuscuta campestris]
MANEKKCKVFGIGDVCLKFNSGSIVNLKNVRHVSDLSYNLLSCASLESEGFEGKWGKCVMKIMKGSIVVFKAEKKNNLYVYKAEPVCEHANSVVDNSVLWHKRNVVFNENNFPCLSLPIPNVENVAPNEVEQLPVIIPTYVHVETNEHVDDSHTNEDETISNEAEHDSVESHSSTLPELFLACFVMLPSLRDLRVLSELSTTTCVLIC